MNKLLKRMVLALISLFIAIFILFIYYKYAIKNIENNYSPKVMHLYSNETRDKGIQILKQGLEKEDILLLGSSDLRIKVDQNPVNLFPNNTSNKNIIISGKPRVQSLLNLIKLGALDVNKDSNIGVIVSLQWFMRSKVEKASFNSNFSELQFYKFMENNNISENLKDKVASRVFNLTNNVANHNATVYTQLDDSHKIFQKAFNPFFNFQKWFLDLQDGYKSSFLLDRYKSKNQKMKNEKSWEELKELAEKQGKASVTNNDMFVDDKYYSRELKPNLKDLENKYKGIDLLKSDEFNDLELLFELCQQLGVKPFIIIESTNGYFYDYAGINKEQRDKYYDKVSQLVEKFGFKYIDLRDYEYEKYFYFDAMHLGWKGWLYVSKEMSEYFQ
ncbi:D-alanyl-lipoteichoic acid biosynthesis protein DltD [Miniphocaeibacter halophilus]|uniref:D-alanyl-lipoteichoic acid biosynthesis protein DltD n=1 Tax=Miniphocaeibacter halophilus TaxID=2931922 RepID=A0AC61MQ46_9FIRM|nr:D-alanyl-lipoteichoic acid biosynthesis protein DltD [Miniphocaeibacter halophilus]QQK07468.1 D-alanyl-lipoteichoic acid biosynthesis protein DltD [Miniphocaeibacter halophilus]